MFDNLTQTQLIAAVAGGYLLGSIPFGVIATRLGGAGDVRKIGSGNIGATNVLRTGRRDLALITLIGDGGKGALAVFLAWWFTRNNTEEAQAVLTSLAGGAAFLGHIFPVWLGFRGGRGVATFFGTLLAAAWPVGVLAALAWIVFAVMFRISSMAALAAAALSPIFVLMVARPYPILALSAFMAVLIYIRHIPNIRRLLKGEEPRIGDKKPEAAANDEESAADPAA
ncbi:glycerol-3-phosphate 1-O-acyltransferase PlsY [Phenylobacterium sp.]|uniref:glycerol-3-phosphate 1-O-acyltransferase PlsY n=1 Tax=Phenylobacterium sp. TaxID=1871053 RepID=UPI0035B4B419